MKERGKNYEERRQGVGRACELVDLIFENILHHAGTYIKGPAPLTTHAQLFTCHYNGIHLKCDVISSD